MALEQLMAIALSDDVAPQKEVHENLGWNREPRTIRFRMMPAGCLRDLGSRAHAVRRGEAIAVRPVAGPLGRQAVNVRGVVLWHLGCVAG